MNAYRVVAISPIKVSAEVVILSRRKSLVHLVSDHAFVAGRSQLTSVASNEKERSGLYSLGSSDGFSSVRFASAFALLILFGESKRSVTNSIEGSVLVIVTIPLAERKDPPGLTLSH